MFHRVMPALPAAFDVPDCYRLRGTAVTLDELRETIDDDIIPLERVHHALARGAEPPDGIVLTFDDGYVEWPAVAMALGVPATWLICETFRADAPRAHPIDALYWLLDHATRPELTWKGAKWRLDDPTSKRQLVTEGPIKFAIARGPDPWSVLDAVAESLAVELPDDLPRRLYMDAQGRATLDALGLIGAHGRTHRPMTGLDDRALLDELRRPVATPGVLAWPDGDHDARTVEAARAAGFDLALTCEPGVVRRGADPLRLPRIFVRPRFEPG